MINLGIFFSTSLEWIVKKGSCSVTEKFLLFPPPSEYCALLPEYCQTVDVIVREGVRKRKYISKFQKAGKTIIAGEFKGSPLLPEN